MSVLSSKNALCRFRFQVLKSKAGKQASQRRTARDPGNGLLQWPPASLQQAAPQAAWEGVKPWTVIYLLFSFFFCFLLFTEYCGDNFTVFKVTIQCDFFFFKKKVTSKNQFEFSLDSFRLYKFHFQLFFHDSPAR